MLTKGAVLALVFCLLLLLTACEPPPSPLSVPGSESSPPANAADNQNRQPATAVPASPAKAEPYTVALTPTPEPTAEPQPPTVVEYNLGDAFIKQDSTGEDDPLHKMPLRLDGLLGVPAGNESHPLLLILHGDHPGCPPDPERDADLWPCAREQEQLNYRGFAYLVEELAAQGYVAVAINANAEFSSGHGDSLPGERLGQIIDMHLGQLVEAAQGGQNQFGVDLYGRIDPQRVAWIAHSTTAELAGRLIRDRRLDDALTAAYTGYGPVAGLLQIAPTLDLPDSLPAPDLPLAVILPACDGRVIDLAGQSFYEALRADPQRSAPATTLLLEAANHNQFNEIVTPDLAAARISPHCRLEKLLLPQEQQAFLAAYAAEYMASLFASPQESAAASARLGLDSAAVVPQELFGRQARLTVSPQAANEALLLRPFSAGELSRNLMGGDVVADNAALTYCPPGTSLHEADAALAPCSRLQANHPGNPAQLLLSWEQPHAALHFSLPPGGLDIHSHAAVQLRAALDPLSPLNAPGLDQSFSISLTDAQGRSASVTVPAGSPALAYPPGEIDQDGRFSGHVHMSAIRLPLDAYANIDLSAISEVSLHFDQSDSGALFIADLGFLRQQRYPGAASTLLVNNGTLDHLRGIGRLHGANSCTAALINSGAPDAPAVVLTNGHCAQQWSASDVLLDVPAANMTMVFNYFTNTQAVQIAVPATRILYSTMKDRDLALVELDTTLGELQERDITPFSLAPRAPDDVLSVSLVGAPTAELPSAAAYLRQENCAAEGQVTILEHDWLFSNTYRLDCQDVYGGSSGSPLFAEGGEEIFAIINTTTIGGREPCTLNAPCEITASGPYFSQDTSYATPVDGIAGCFDENGRFDLTSAACPLDDGRQLQINGVPRHAVRPTVTLADGTQQRGTWNAALSGDLPFYRTKSGPLATTECHVDVGYSDVVSLAEQPLINEPLPDAEGFHVLCLLAGPTAVVDETWQQPPFATFALIEIDTTPPSIAPALTITTSADDVLIEPNYAPPEIAAIHYKSGPLATTDCADPAGYSDFAARPLTLPTSQLPAMLCTVAHDSAGNPGQPVRHLLDTP